MTYHFRSWPPTQEDILQLVDSAVPEGPCLDFKEKFITPEKLRERICAFANASGGEFVFGIAELKGVAGAITPITLDTAPDRKEINIREIIRTGIYPQVSGVQIEIIPIETENAVGHIVVIRIPKSGSGPHMVTEKKLIYTRESTQSRPMEYHELRKAFLGTEEQAQRLRQFRKERCESIFNRDTPVQMEFKRSIITHVMPMDALAGGRRFSATTLKEAMKLASPPLSRDTGYNTRVDADGVFQTYTKGTKPYHGMTYVHVSHSGIVETANCQTMARSLERGKIPHSFVDQDIGSAVQQSAGILDRLGIEPPYIVFLSLLDMENAYSDVLDEPDPCRSSSLFAHEFALDHIPETSEAAAQSIRPALDNLANGFGLVVSPSFAEDGSWQFYHGR
ncbi:MAG: ATP-binding protein [Luteolibacter sp.]